MKIAIKSANGEDKGSVTLPYRVTIRADLIRRAFKVIEANDRQAYGADPEAGMKHSATLSRRRHDYRGSYGHGISRVPRKIHTRRGTRMNWVATEAPGTVGGRRAHAPKAEKSFNLKINAKENRLAIRSAIVAALTRDVTVTRGHKTPEGYPFVVDSSFEALTKTKDLVASLEKLGFADELKRASVKKVRAGKGTMRGRKYATRKSALVVTENKALAKAVANVPGFEVASVEHLNAKLLAPGGEPGRVVLFTENSFNTLVEKKLYTEDVVKTEVSEKKTTKKVAKPATKKAVTKKAAKSTKN